MGKIRFDIMTLFPDLVDTVLSESIIGRARKSGIVEVYVHNIRDWSKDKFRRVDDTPYGGGKGMLMKPDPICDCFEGITAGAAEKPYTVYMSPKGTVFCQQKAKELSRLDRIVILCGHYEGVDQRAIDRIVDEEISIGDYVLTGGEIPATVIFPLTGTISAFRSFARVDLPLPFFPSTARNSPFFTSRLTPRTASASAPSYLKYTSEIFMIGSFIFPPL